MRTNQWLLTGLLLISSAGCATGMAHADKEGDEKDEVKMKFDQIPANIQAVLSREAKGARIDQVDKESLNGKTVYEADVIVDGKNREIVVGADGALVHNIVDEEEGGAGKKMGEKEHGEKAGEKDEEDEKNEKAGEHEKSDEQPVTMDQVPAAAKATLVKEAGTGKIGEIDKEVKEGKTKYEAKVMLDGKKWEISVAADGQLLKKKLEEDEEDEKDEAKEAK